ncbi:MAG: archaetidylserine decarboxylase [Steroidobacteraceae bacterium]
MTPRSAIGRLLQQERLNFLLTNRIPRRSLTRFMGWFSRIEQPWIRAASIAIWRFLADVDLSDASKTRFNSLHDCFTRELKPGARTVDPDPLTLVSPCDAIVGAMGQIEDGVLLQAKGRPYRLIELLGDADMVRYYANGHYATLRLTAGMYHRFHAPCDCRVERVTYVPGDTWNVNPIALKRVEALFCQNERATLSCRLQTSDHLVTLVPIAAILVASIRLHFLDLLLHLKYRGPHRIPCAAQLAKGEEMGWFQHGSTMLVFAPAGFHFHPEVQEGVTVRMGQPLLRLPA